MKLHPNNFIVNNTWIAIKVNESFIYVQKDPYDAHALMDAASCYVFGFIFCKTIDIIPSDEEVNDLFKKAWSAKSEWAKELIIPENYPAGTVFAEQAQKNGLKVINVNKSDLDLIIGPLKQSFEEDFLRSPEKWK
ncbi:integron gene cassette protein [Candidatus Magnetomorum sp. HK-1]|nr:integron gene cassette protein [Candidatus Magnetomorum sp. HK-1]